jgi:hypothetical protein
LVSGNYGVEFRSVDGYFPPSATPVSAALTNSFTFFYAATTNLDTGMLSVLIQPGDVATAATSTRGTNGGVRAGPTNWLNSGDVVPSPQRGQLHRGVQNPLLVAPTPLPQLIQVGGAEAIYSGIGTYFINSSPVRQRLRSYHSALAHCEISLTRTTARYKRVLVLAAASSSSNGSLTAAHVAL